LIGGKTIDQWQKRYPLIKDIMEKREVFWANPDKKQIGDIKGELPLKMENIKEAESRLERFTPFIAEKFPETAQDKGIIESKLVKINQFKDKMHDILKERPVDDLLIKCDHRLPIAGSIKARGGIYEVLKHAEDLALAEGILKKDDNYAILAGNKFKNFFAEYSLAVGSTGNLGLSIGITGAALGFRTTVHMSHDARKWKKDLLRDHGVKVREYESDYSKAVKEGWNESKADPRSYFVDDEKSEVLFLGYSVAALRLKIQLEKEGIVVNRENPLFVYLPCGVGGSPGGICFGLRMVFGDNVHCFFC
jgi:D-serine dehydratase